MQVFSKIMLLCAAICLALFTLWIFTPLSHREAIENITGLGQFILSLLIFIVGSFITLNKSFSVYIRRAWGFMTLGTLSNIIASLMWLYFNSTGMNPFPSVADIFYLLIYPLVLAGILSFPYAPLKRLKRILFSVDLAIIVLAFGVFLWHLLLSRLIEKGVSGLPGLVSMAYPLADLLLLIGLVSLIQQDVKDMERRVLIFIFIGVFLGIVSDIIFAFVQTIGIQFPFLLFSIYALFRLGSNLAFLSAAVWQLHSSKVEIKPMKDFLPLLRSNLLYIAVFAGMCLAFIALLNLAQSNWRVVGTLIGTMFIVALVLLRQYLVMIDNQRLHSEVVRLANTDPLTGLGNRRLCEQTLSQEISRSGRTHSPLSILLIDVDNFKKYNDTYGHLKGDQLLKECAYHIKSHVRAIDLVTRFGGDEFVVILPETDKQTANLVACRLREMGKIKLAAGTNVSLSIGSATFCQDMTATNLLELADQAMYKEKPYNSRV